MQYPRNIFAYTEPGGSYPGYASLNVMSDGMIHLTVRSPRDKDGRCGDSGNVVLPREQLKVLLADLLIELNR